MSKIINGKIMSTERLSEDIYRMEISSSYVANNARPGQFVNIRCSEAGSDMLLRRPVSICRAWPEKDSFDIIFIVRGQGTEQLSCHKTGDTIELIGPLGKGFYINEECSRIAVIGGGIGIFPLLFLLQGIESGPVVKHSYLGFRNAGCAVFLEEFENVSTQVFISCDDGSMGEKGLVTDLFLRRIKDESYDFIYTCGPVEMMKKIVCEAGRRNIPCQVSMEQRMGCGVGACMVCACKTRTGNGSWKYSRVCKDGPVFWGKDIVFG